jgi:hypothetical protein
LKENVKTFLIAQTLPLNSAIFFSIQVSHPDRWQEAVDAALSGQVVQTKYKPITYTVSNVVWNLTVDSPYKANSDETIRQYFERVNLQSSSRSLDLVNSVVLSSSPNSTVVSIRD